MGIPTSLSRTRMNTGLAGNIVRLGSFSCANFFLTTHFVKSKKYYNFAIKLIIHIVMKKLLTCLLATFGLTTACCQLNYRNTDPEGFAKLIVEPEVVVLDVRTAEEYNEGHIEGAILIDYHQSDFMEKAKATLPISKTIAIYCRSGRRSAYAAEKLADEGYKAVNLYGGIIAWKEAGMSITK